MLTSLALVCSLVLVAPRQDAGKPAAPPPNVLARPVVIGASMSFGFNTGHKLDEVLEACLRGQHQQVKGFAVELFFTDPQVYGRREVTAALDADATLVVALDFLFWFGYGSKDATGRSIDREAQRLELLEKGLALLDDVDCPLVIGDFPDMSAALGKMLGPEQMPKASTLPLLSRRVRDWAAKRKQTIVLPLSEMVLQLGGSGELHVGRHTFPAGTQLLQDDHLHPTLDGLTATAQLICDLLVQQKLAPESDFDFDLASVQKKLGPLNASPRGALSAPK